MVTLGNLDINKNLVATSQGHTDPGDTLINGNPPVAIGEILTYEILLNVPPGTISSVTVLDTLDPGLAFVDCVSIVRSSANLTTSLGPDFSSACAPDPVSPGSGNPQILPEPGGSLADEDQGRRILFTLGNMTNTNGFGGNDETLTIRYQVVVLDSNANLRGVRLNNLALWEWSSGDLQDFANEVEIAEPSLSLTKDADPRIVPPGAPITFTLTVQHTAGQRHDRL